MMSVATLRAAPSAATVPRTKMGASSARPALHIARASKDENPYHDRKYTKASGTPGGSKDINAVRKDKQEQYEYQQERLEWRRKNQQGGDADEDRMEPAHNNMATDMSAERRGPDVPDSAPDSASLSKATNAIGKAIRKVTGVKDEDEKADK